MSRVSARRPRLSGDTRVNVTPAVRTEQVLFYCPCVYADDLPGSWRDKNSAYIAVADYLVAAAPQIFHDRHSASEIKEIRNRLARWLEWRDSRIPVWRTTGMLPRYSEMAKGAKWVRIQK